MLFVHHPNDLRHSRRRRPSPCILDDYGDRVQFSVFEIFASQDTLPRLLARLNSAIDSSQDSVRIYPVCSACAAKVLRLGRQDPEPWWEPEVYIV